MQDENETIQEERYLTIDKAERIKRIIEDFKKIFPGDDNAVKFAKNISDEILDELED